MILEFLETNFTVLLSAALTVLVVALRFFFWQMEMRKLRMFGHEQRPTSKKHTPTYKRTSFADAA